ncbi:hypothetical protein ON010_g16706 [Phytophthora cinnamomi]|nr:hypothetical protein ON010_g16706 [Phytophthora cinnamomi]
MRLATRALAAHGRRRAALVVGRSQAHALQPFAPFSTGTEPPSDKEEVALPSHIKFRMPDLDFKIDTPDLCFQLESGDEGVIARLLVDEGASSVAPGQPLAIIVPTEAEIEPFLQVLKENPRCIEGYVEPTTAEPVVDAEVAATSSASPPTASAASSDVLRMLNKLQKEGLFEDEKALKVLKSLARKNDEQLLTTYKASYEDGVLEESAFDRTFFVENALELVEEAAGTSTEPNVS